MSIAAQLSVAIAAARNFPALEEISRTLWQAHAAGALSDDAAQAAAEAVEARKAVLRGPRPVPTQKRASARRTPCRSPDRERSIRRRRAAAMSGAVSARIAAAFTLGETAVLSVIAREVRRSGDCRLCIDAIAALAGVSRRLAQNAIRQAERLGLLTVHARPRPGQKNETNLIEVICPQWRTWLRLGIDRVQKNTSHDVSNIKQLKKQQAKAVSGWRFAAFQGRFTTRNPETTPCKPKLRF
jgi:hypothetical protein